MSPRATGRLRLVRGDGAVRHETMETTPSRAAAGLVVVPLEQLEDIVERAVRAALRDHASEGQGQHITAAEAAARLDVSEKTIRRRIASGELPAVRVGRSVRIDVRHLAPGEETVAQLARQAIAGR